MIVLHCMFLDVRGGIQDDSDDMFDNELAPTIHGMLWKARKMGSAKRSVLSHYYLVNY